MRVRIRVRVRRASVHVHVLVLVHDMYEEASARPLEHTHITYTMCPPTRSNSSTGDSNPSRAAPPRTSCPAWATASGPATARDGGSSVTEPQRLACWVREGVQRS